MTARPQVLVPWHPPTTFDIPRHVILSPRQAEVLTGICAGLSNAEIGRKNFMALDTVKTHVKLMLGKLGARDRCQAAVLVISGQVVVHVNKTVTTVRRAA